MFARLRYASTFYFPLRLRSAFACFAVCGCSMLFQSRCCSNAKSVMKLWIGCGRNNEEYNITNRSYKRQIKEFDHKLKDSIRFIETENSEWKMFQSTKQLKAMLLISLLIISPLFLVQPQESEIVPCTSLMYYVEPNSQDNLDIFRGGGAINSDVAVFFNIPRTQISPGNPQVKFCMENLPIPTSVGGTKCDGWGKCWLVIGTHAASKVNGEDTKYCHSDDKYRGTAPCYTCICSGVDFEAGSVPDDVTLTDACGLSSQGSWGALCPDIYNGRLIFPYDGSPNSYSNLNYSSVQINICGGIEDNCPICRGGGYQPPFKVGLQWVNNMQQCFDESPFTSAGHIYNISNTMSWTLLMAFILMYLILML